MPDSAPPRSGTPSFEHDFRALREAREISVDELHQETRVPVDVLRRFESGELLADASFSDVYLKAFVKSYAKALGVPQARAVEAFEAHRTGRYVGQLREDYTPPAAPASRTTAAPPEASGAETPEASVPPAGGARGGNVDDEPGGAPGGAQQASPSGAPASAPEAAPAPAAAPAVQALRTGGTAVPVSQSTTRVEPTRVRRPIVPEAKRSFDKNWGTLGALALILLAICGGAVWFLVFRDAGDAEPEPQQASGEAQEAAMPDTTAAPAGPTGPRLQTPITLTVDATDGGLQWFRVTEDGGERSPHWIDEGTSQTFTADSALVVWGEGNQGGPALDFSQATLELQGLRWRPADGSTVTVTVQNGQALLDSLAGAGVSGGAPAAAPEASGDAE